MTRVVNTKSGICVRVDAEGEWITLPNGAHIHLTEGGAVDRGPKEVKKEFNGKLGKTKLTKDVTSRSKKLVSDLKSGRADVDYVFENAPKGAVISVVGKDGSKRKVEVSERKGKKVYRDYDDPSKYTDDLYNTFYDNNTGETESVDWDKTDFSSLDNVKGEDLESFSDYIEQTRHEMFDD